MSRTYRATPRYPDGNAMFLGAVDAEKIIRLLAARNVEGTAEEQQEANDAQGMR
jgi:hypothetical protein